MKDRWHFFRFVSKKIIFSSILNVFIQLETFPSIFFYSMFQSLEFDILKVELDSYDYYVRLDGVLSICRVRSCHPFPKAHFFWILHLPQNGRIFILFDREYCLAVLEIEIKTGLSFSIFLKKDIFLNKISL